MNCKKILHLLEFWSLNPKCGIWRPTYKRWINNLCKSIVINDMVSNRSLYEPCSVLPLDKLLMNSEILYSEALVIESQRPNLAPNVKKLNKIPIKIYLCKIMVCWIRHTSPHLNLFLNRLYSYELQRSIAECGAQLIKLEFNPCMNPTLVMFWDEV